MRLLFTANSAWNIWHFRQPLLRAFRASGYHISVLAPPDAAVDRLSAMGCDFIPLALDAKTLGPLSNLTLVLHFRRAFIAARPDVVLSFTIKNNVFGALAARMAGVPFIPNVTGLGTAFLSGRALRRLAVLLSHGAFRSLPVVFFQNADDRDEFVRERIVTAAQARLLPGSGIDLKHFNASPLPPESDPPTFLMIARILRDKGVFEYVEAAQRVRQSVPNARFRLLGQVDAANRNAIGAQAVDAWVREGAIDYLGTTDDVRPHIGQAHCVVLPSYREGAPRTLIEAAAMARPLIATDVPGCRDLVAHERNGLLCEVRSGKSLADACERFIALPFAAKRRMGDESRHKIELNYSDTLVVDAYRRAIGEVTGTGNRFAQ